MLYRNFGTHTLAFHDIQDYPVSFAIGNIGRDILGGGLLGNVQLRAHAPSTFSLTFVYGLYILFHILVYANILYYFGILIIGVPGK